MPQNEGILSDFGKTETSVFIFVPLCAANRARENERDKIAKEGKHIGTHWEMDQLCYKYSLNSIETISCC